MTTENKTTKEARKRYNRLAPFYDLMEGLAERRYTDWRKLLWSKVEGKKILEVGVGTGKNFLYYPPNAEITAIDFSDRMLARATERASRQKINVRLEQMDVQHLTFADNSFDTVIDSFVFCSVPDPIRGLKEIERVCQPGGKVVMLEHVLSANPILTWIMNTINPAVTIFMGASINRRTVENVNRSGLKLERVTDLGAGIFKLIEARKLPSVESR